MCCLWNLDDLFEPLPLWFLYWSLFSLRISPDACLLPRISLPDSTHTGTLVWGANGGGAETQIEEAQDGLNRALRGGSELHWRKWHTPRHLNSEATGVWGKAFGERADGGMNSAAGPPPAPPLPCVHHVTSSNASHNWCAGMAPSSPDFAEWQKHWGHCCGSETLNILWRRVQDFLKRWGTY